MQIEKMIEGPLPKGANFRGEGWINVQQIASPKLIELLAAGFVVTLQQMPGTGDVRMVAVRYGEAIEIPAKAKP